MTALFRRYPRQFWLIFAGYIINRTSGGLIWPFLSLYMREQLDLPLATVTLLFSIQAVAGLISTSVVGSLMDRFGRKWIVAVSLLVGSAVLVAMRSADTLAAWAVCIALYGMVIPVFGVGGNAMVADIIPEDQRAGAYALIRMGQNIGIAIGPAIGGFLVVRTFGLTYLITAAVYIILALLVMALTTETLPQRDADTPRTRSSGYSVLLRDRSFILFCGAYVLVEMAATLIFILLPVYAKENFRIAEDQYGFIVTINAVMVVFLQYGVTQITARFRPLLVMAVGALFYGAGTLSVALGSSFAAFAMSMVIITMGELMSSPTALSLVARMAPADMRARYMGAFNLTWTIGSGTAPAIGGWLNDHIAPAAIWYGGLVMGLSAAVGFLLMARAAQPTPETTEIAPAMPKSAGTPQ